MNTYNDILKKIQYYKQMIDSYTESDEKSHIDRRWRLKQNKKNVKKIKYELFLLRTSAFPNEININELKDKLLFLKEEKEKILTFYRSSCTDYWVNVNQFDMHINYLKEQLQELSIADQNQS